MKRVIGIGAGGHARVVIDILRLARDVELVGLLDASPEIWGYEVEGVKVLGDDSLLAVLYRQGITCAFVGVGSSGSTAARQRVYQMAKRQGYQLVHAIHPRAVVAASAILGEGACVMANAVINPGALLGDNVVVNTGAIVEHDCTLGDHVFVATGANLAGSVHVGEGAHIGMGASVRQGLRIGRGAIVGAGAAVVDDVPDNVVVVGVPARVLRPVAADG